MSANLAVDLGNTTLTAPSLTSTAITSSNVTVGGIVDLLNADTYTSLLATGRNVHLSGQLQIQVQTADTTASGDFTEPMSGLAEFPTAFVSGGIIQLNSGTIGGQEFGPGMSGRFMWSGFTCFAAFQRPHRYARVLELSSDLWLGAFQASFVSQLRTTGSGAGGYETNPSSGPVNV